MGIVPACVALSRTQVDEDLTSTLVADAHDAGLLDALQVATTRRDRCWP
jgi:hypothetical protein